MKRIVTLVLVAVMALGLVACGSGISKIEGKWKLYSMTEGGQTYKGKQLESLLEIAGIKVSLNVNSDKTAELNYGDNKEKLKVDTDKQTFTAKGESIKYTVKDGKLTMSKDGTKMVFEKK